MTGTDLNDALDALLAAEGLTAKAAVIAGAPELLLTEAAEQVLLTRAGRLPPSLTGPIVHRDLIRACRDLGMEDGPAGFADALVNLWLDKPSLDDKAALLLAWKDPLLSDRMVEGLGKIAEAATDEAEAARLRWHIQLLQRCRVRGVELGVAAQRATSQGIAVSAETPPKASDTDRLIDELKALAADNAPESWRRQAEILETLLATLPDSGTAEIAEMRAQLGKRLAATLTKILDSGILDAEAASAAFERAHLLAEDAETITRRRDN